MKLLEKSILATIAYYDVLDYPLTGFEIFKYLINPLHIVKHSYSENPDIEPIAKISFLEVLSILKSESFKKLIQEKKGLYCLKKRNIDELIERRTEKRKICDKKWKKAKKTIKWLQAIPYLKGVFVSGSLALNSAKQESDVDLLIVAKYKKIWTVRFLITIFIQLIGKRRHGNKTKDRLCLNHYITDKSLKIDFFSLYNAQTYAHLFPALEIQQDILSKFQKENEWIRNYVFSFGLISNQNQRKIINNNFLLKISKVQELILNILGGGLIEKFLEFIQRKIIKFHSLKEQKKGRVTTDDLQLEFHPSSPEKNIISGYNNNISKLGLDFEKEPDSGLT